MALTLGDLLGKCYSAEVLGSEPLPTALAAFKDWVAAMDAHEDSRAAAAQARYTEAQAKLDSLKSIKEQRCFISHKYRMYLTDALTVTQTV